MHVYVKPANVTIVLNLKCSQRLCGDFQLRTNDFPRSDAFVRICTNSILSSYNRAFFESTTLREHNKYSTTAAGRV